MPLPGNRRFVVDTQKDTQFSDAWTLLAAILLVAGVVVKSLFLTTAALFLIAIAAVAWAWAQVSLTGFRYERRFSETRAFLGETVTLSLDVHNRKPLPMPWLTMRDIFPSALPISQNRLEVNPSSNLAEFTTFWMIGPYQHITRRFEVSCTERGFHRYGPAQALTGDPFGFFNRSTTCDDKTSQSEARLIVYPRLYSASEMQLPAKNPFGESRAQGSLFEDPLRTAGIRDWEPADGMRRVHWKASARYQEMLSRVYEPSEEHVLQLFLNVATLERHWHGFIPILQERTISVAASLALLATEQRRAVGLIANGALPGSDQPIRLMPGRSPQQLVHILELLAAVTPFATQPIEQLISDESPRLPWGATLVVVTAIAHEALLASLSNLAAVGRRITLISLAENPPQHWTGGMTVYHLPHLVDDLIAPQAILPQELPA